MCSQGWEPSCHQIEFRLHQVLAGCMVGLVQLLLVVSRRTGLEEYREEAMLAVSFGLVVMAKVRGQKYSRGIFVQHNTHILDSIPWVKNSEFHL